MSEDIQSDPDDRRPVRPRRGDDDRPRRRRRDDDDDDDYDVRDKGDATGGIIPYKNPQALISYYCGVFSLIPCLGMALGPVALILGFLGLAYKNKHPTAGGTAHALVGIIIGSLVVLGHLAAVIFVAAGGLKP